MVRLLIIDDEEASCRTLKLYFESNGYEVESALCAEEGLAALLARPADVVISDIRMPGRDGLFLLREIQKRSPEIPVIMITAFQDLESTVSAMHGGAVDYVTKPIDLDELERAIDKALAVSAGINDNVFVVEAETTTELLLGQGAAMNEVFKAIGRVSQGRVTVLIEGEPGTGRETVARAVHQASGDDEELFAAVSCNTAVDVLLESELFGHIAGAFSGADTIRDGKVKRVEGGTLFLDEIDQLSLRLQGKLLHLLRDQDYTPMGATHGVSSSVRIIGSTDKDLKNEVQQNRFREDLYYALSVATIVVPPLRRRPEDIPYLVEHLVHKINKELNKNVRQVSWEVIDQLTAFAWPGNLRQLENVLMQAAVMVPGDVLTVGQLPREVLTDATGRPKGGDDIILDGRDKTLKDLEREYIFKVLNDTGWHKGKTCTILGISRPRLERRIAEFGFVRVL